MSTARIRQAIYFRYQRLNGRSLGAVYRRYRSEDDARTASARLPERLREMLRHARTSVPHYRGRLAEVEDAIESDPVEALRHLPVLTKAGIRGNFEELKSLDVGQRRTRDQTSGGSTGEPVHLVQDAEFQDRVIAAKLLYSTWTGFEPGEPEVTIWGSEQEILEGRLALRARLADRVLRRSVVNAFRMSAESMRACLENLNRDPPRLIVAYVQSLDDLAAFAEREGIEVTRQRAIISTAGTLQPHMRERIERVFGCRPLDRYGSREVGDIAGECSHHRGLHVLPWTAFVEVLDDDDSPAEPGDPGRIVVTSLANFAMPLLRYDIGDRASLVGEDAPPCPCGRGGQRIARLLGRTVDTFKAPDGSMINGEYFTHMLYFKDFVERFQVIQHAPSRITYRLVTSGRAPQEDLDEIIDGTRAVLGEACEVEFDFVDEIAPSPSGKYRYTISEC
jgi:phenylacetate-CoA ligase